MAVESLTGISWLTIATRPIAPATAVRPSSSGRPAATSAPKASSRMPSVIGSDSVSAFCMSFSKTPPSSFSMLASPNWEMLNSGWAFWRLFVAARTGLTRSLVTMSLPGISNMTFTVCRSGEIR